MTPPDDAPPDDAPPDDAPPQPAGPPTLETQITPPRPGLQRVVIFTDGSCRGNPGPGGWGAILTMGPHEREIWGGEPDTTNNRMELTAAIEALTALKRPCRVELHTDSQYVKNGVTQWLSLWKARGWRTMSKGAVKNEDLWRRLDEARLRHEVDWRWVKGHAGDEMNERADVLARRGLTETEAAMRG